MSIPSTSARLVQPAIAIPEQAADNDPAQHATPPPRVAPMQDRVCGSGGTDQPEDVPHCPVDQPRVLLRVEEAAACLAIGRTRMFALLRDQVIESVKVGRLRRVPADALTAYVTDLAANQRPAAA